jgi:hypothetical protein
LDDGRPPVHSFAGDEFRVCAEHLGLKHVRDLQTSRPLERWQEPEEPDPRALEIWRATAPFSDVVEVYLRSRALTIPIPPTLRQGTGRCLSRTPMPTMVAAVQGADRRVIAVQKTWLTWDGRKAPVAEPRKTIGALHLGGVRLGAATEILGLGEGVETALSAMQLSGVATWAALGSRLSSVFIPPSVRELHIFADADKAGGKSGRRRSSPSRGPARPHGQDPEAS